MGTHANHSHHSAHQSLSSGLGDQEVNEGESEGGAWEWELGCHWEYEWSSQLFQYWRDHDRDMGEGQSVEKIELTMVWAIMTSNQIWLTSTDCHWDTFLETWRSQQTTTSHNYRTKSPSSQFDIDRQGMHAQLNGHVMSAKRSDSLFVSKKWIKRCSDPDNCFTVAKGELLLSKRSRTEIESQAALTVSKENQTRERGGRWIIQTST